MAPFFKRITQKVPDAAGRQVIWIHGVSVGEIKSAGPFFQKLRRSYPNAYFLITTTTTSGQAEARRSFSEADAICYLPIDIPWIVSHWVQKLKPRFFFLIETDFWPFLLQAIRKNGGKNILISGKISARSAQRFRLFFSLSKRLFSLFDLLCVQNQEHYQRLAPFVANPNRLQITGNLKLDLRPESIDIQCWRAQIQIPSNAIAITCTHPSEESQLLDLLYPCSYFFFLAPRHPERFEEVADLLQRRNIPFIRFSQLSQKRLEGKRVVLMDVMGKLSVCYSLSRLAILGGSFTPIGGHNILEPCLYHIPVLFGPHMHTQTELVSLVLNAKAGQQLSLLELPHAVHSYFSDSSIESEMKKGVTRLLQNIGGAVENTLRILSEEKSLEINDLKW